LEWSGVSDGERESKIPLKTAVPKSPTWCQQSVDASSLVIIPRTASQDRQGERFLPSVLGLLVFKPLRRLSLDCQRLLQDPVRSQVARHRE
jgi:hypothetical protein